ncbi:DUF2868 domain-containing protein [Faucicola boevrei]|uniref:DUF2868 domain-containing protein n=1 Tax=Faucicola boevrei TaxID=346665 RepID=UPI00036356E8|nr:DUF2868 domain-containing protein [Moraxella boevrei]
MYTPQDQLTELVRRLEEKNHIFTADPLLITEKLQKEPSDPRTKLSHRANRIDSNGKLAKRLAILANRMNSVIWSLTLVWLLVGFVGLFGIMQNQTINFFYVLASILGINSVMLVVWLLWLMFAPQDKTPLFSNFLQPKTLMRNADIISLTSVELYQDQLNRTGKKWFFGRLTHQFWLASLMGMLLALVALFLVKNYNFVWQSTLLSQYQVANIVNIMAYLPNLVGFPIPTEQDILQTTANPTTAYRWAMFLIGCVLMYGILPRLALWLLCLTMFKSKRLKLDLNNPYYQKIVQFWQRQIIDPDNSPTEQKPVAPPAEISQAKKLVALMEYPYNDEFWYQFAVGDNLTDSANNANHLENFGVLDDRDDMAKLNNYLQNHHVQVLIGIPPQSLPDRGTMRKLDQIASLAKGGLVVQLLDFKQDFLPNPSELAQLKQRKEQWETALAERQIPLIR